MIAPSLAWFLYGWRHLCKANASFKCYSTNQVDASEAELELPYDDTLASEHEKKAMRAGGNSHVRLRCCRRSVCRGLTRLIETTRRRQAGDAKKDAGNGLLEET